MKREEELVEKFRKLEDEIVDKLQSTKLEVDFNLDRKDVVKSLKNYVLKVKAVEKLFDEYEKTASKLEELTGEEESMQSVTTAVVELREDSDKLKDEIGILTETLNEVENINGNIIVKQKKKKSNDSVKEM